MLRLSGLHQVPTSLAVAAIAFLSAPQLPTLAQFPDASLTPAPALDGLPNATADPVEQAARPQVRPSSYLLGAGDEIAITVFGYEEYTGSQVILPDGTLTLPIIGIFTAAGRTPTLLAQELTAALSPYLVDPVVTVSLVSLRPIIVNVAGEVQRPGPVQLRSVTTNNNNNVAGLQVSLDAAPNLSSALLEAGGVTHDADIRQVMLRRALPNGESTTLQINLWDSIWSDAPPENLVLQDGDSIFVPTVAEGDMLDRRLLARSRLAPSTVRVRVVGEVTRPGEVDVPPNSSISSAVAIAGGPTEDARLSQVAFIRLNGSNEVDRQMIDLRDLSDNFQVQEGDVIMVPKRTTSSFLDFAGRILTPFSLFFNLFN